MGVYRSVLRLGESRATNGILAKSKTDKGLEL